MAQKQVKFYMSDQEYRQAQNNAQEVGLTVNQYAKRLAVDVTSIESRQDQEVARAFSQYALAIQQAKAELRRIGSNVNQIARLKNLALYYETPSRDEATFGRGEVPDFDLFREVQAGEDAKTFNRLAGELRALRSQLERLESQLDKEGRP